MASYRRSSPRMWGCSGAGQRAGHPLYHRIEVISTKQLLLHLTFQRGCEVSILAVVGERFMEPLRDHRQAAGRVEHAPGPLLHQQEVIRLTPAYPGMRARDRREGQGTAC